MRAGSRSLLRVAIAAACLLWLAHAAWVVHRDGLLAWLPDFLFGGLPPLLIGYLAGRALARRRIGTE